MMIPVILAEAVVAIDQRPEARAAYLAGDFSRSVALYRAYLATHPQDADALVGLGTALTVQGRHAEAETALRQASDAAPENTDAWLGRARVALRTGDRAAARSHLDRALALSPDTADAAPIERGLLVWRADVVVAKSRLSGGLPDWTETSVYLGRKLGPDIGGAISLQATDRFGRNDFYVDAALEGAWRSGAAWRLSLGGAPDADYRARVAVRGGIDTPPLAGGKLTLGLDVGAAEYVLDNVVNVDPSATLNVLGDRMQVSARMINVRSEMSGWTRGYLVRLRAQATPTISLNLTYADAPETSEGRVAKVRSKGVGAAFDISPAVTLSVNVSTETRPTFDRDEAVVVLTGRF
jgi:YaiO family outer membrane protein